MDAAGAEPLAVSAQWRNSSPMPNSKTRSRRAALRHLPLLLGVVLTACHVGQNPRAAVLDADSAARVDIEATMLAYRTALLGGDHRTLATFFTADARLSEPGAADLVGPREIGGAKRAFYDAGGVVTDIAVDTDELHVDGAVAFAFGTWEERFRGGAGAEETVRGRYAIRWQRGAEARWRIARFLVNHQPPADTASP
jgi:ketosteroid isomerase-like protein